MRSRAEIKRQAFYQFKTNYWPTVGVYVLFLLVGLLANIPVAGFFIALFVITVLTVGYNGYFVERFQGRPASLSMLFTPFNRYGRALGGVLWMYLWIALWALIFIIPFVVIYVVVSINTWLGSGAYVAGIVVLCCSYALLIPVIIKALSYFCTIYILADSPNVPATNALELSKRMMHGNKAKVFVAGLSFLPWMLVVVGIAFAIIIPTNLIGYASYFSGLGYLAAQGTNILAYIAGYAYMALFLGPYMATTFAGFYLEIKEDALRRGVVTQQDFGPAYLMRENPYGQQQYGRPQQGQPPYGTPPQYNQPQQGQPPYGTPPQYGRPQQGQPPYGTPPQYGQPQPPPPYGALRRPAGGSGKNNEGDSDGEG